MVNIPVTSDAFKFLDVRSPKLGRSSSPRYTITRQLFAFPETPFENTLKTVTRNANYYADLAKLAAAENTPKPKVSVTGGFIDDLPKLEAILLNQETAPENKLASFVAALPPAAARDQTYFVTITAAVWDKFLAAILMAISGVPAPNEAVGKLSAALRVAAAIFAVRADPANTELDVYTTASIQVPTDLLDPDQARATRPARDRKLGDTSARDLQNQSASRLVLLEAAAGELRSLLLTQEYEARPPAPPIAGVPAAGLEVLTSITAPAVRLSIANAELSAPVRGLLVAEFAALQQANTIDNVDIVGATGSIGAEIERIGRELFGAARPSQVLAASQQLGLLQRELRVQGLLAPEKIKRISLLVAPPTLGDPAEPGQGVMGVVSVLGVGDLKVVKQTLLRYDPGEVANIENVLVGQTKERTHSVKQTTEDTLTVEQEKSVSTEKDLQTTDRFELSDESQNAVKDQRQNEAGVTVTASYGPVSISANTKFSDSSSQEQSSKVSRQFAREVIDKSVEKVEQRVRQQRIRKTTLEVEEVNKYSQTAATKSVVGIYRWVDKIYWAQVNVYGKRMMLEFMLPEPAAVYLHSLSSQLPDPNAVKKPDPLTITAGDITRYNYAVLAAHYAAVVESPPPPMRVTKFVNRSNTDTQASKIQLDDGWFGAFASASATWTGYAGGRLLVQIGHSQFDSTAGAWSAQSIGGTAVGDIPLSVTTSGVTSYNVTGSVVAVPSDAAMQKWQLTTYKAIVDAYQLRLTDYRDYLASQRRTDPNVPVGQDALNRDIERRELQRACIETLTQQHFDGPGAIVDNPVSGWPEINFDEASRLGKTVSFFQQSFEWEQMTYVFYPYFWGRQSKWAASMSASGGDQLFTQFLMAGFARVLVPVKPAHESDLAFFLATGVVWGGTEPPVVGDPRYVAILDEIKESLDASDGGVVEGDPWQVKVPTSLVILDDSGRLPSWPNDQLGQSVFIPSKETCYGFPYNAAQWKDGRTIADAIRKLGYAIDTSDDQDAALRAGRGSIRALQARFNELGTTAVVGRPLQVDGILGPCTLRALTYFDAMRVAGKWPGVG